MGKKGKGNKLAKMSEEERARYLQLRADIEEEARRRKMQLLMLFMKNKLKREDAFCRLNMAKINQEWRSLLRQIKLQELRREIIDLEKFCREAMLRKDNVIKRLLNDLDIAENMYCTLQQSHMEIVRKLISTQQQRTDFLRHFYETEKSAILAEYRADFADFKAARDTAQEQLECVKYQLEDMAAKDGAERHDRHLERLDDINAEVQIRIENIQNIGEAKLEKLWQEYQDVLAGYMSYTEGFYSEYIDLKERDEENTATISEHCHEIERATDQLAHLKLQYADTIEKQNVKVEFLQKKKNGMSTNLRELKERFDKEVKDDEERFRLMSVASHTSLKHLERIAAKGETILQLAAICAKFETEREHLLPLGLPPLPRQMFEEDEQQESIVPEELKEYSFCNWLQMENFWRRVNNAAIDVACLKREKSGLEAENARLKHELQEYLINLNIGNGSNSHINDYLAKRPTSMRVDRVTPIELEEKKCQSADTRQMRAWRPFTSCIEANFTNAVRSRQLLRGKPKLAKIVTIVNW